MILQDQLHSAIPPKCDLGLEQKLREGPTGAANGESPAAWLLLEPEKWLKTY
jgi:hypothetical protein